ILPVMIIIYLMFCNVRRQIHSFASIIVGFLIAIPFYYWVDRLGDELAQKFSITKLLIAWLIVLTGTVLTGLILKALKSLEDKYHESLSSRMKYVIKPWIIPVLGILAASVLIVMIFSKSS